DDGEDVDVVLADHDFFGVRLAGKTLAFVPARSVRLLPSSVPALAASPSGRGVVPEVQPLGAPDRDLGPAAGAHTPAPAPAAGTPALLAPPSAPAAPALPRGPLTSRPGDARGCPIPGGGAPAESGRRSRPPHRRGGERHRGQDRRAVSRGRRYDGGRRGRRAAVDLPAGTSRGAAGGGVESRPYPLLPDGRARTSARLSPHGAKAAPPGPYKLRPADAGDRLRGRGADPALPSLRRGRVHRPLERERNRPERLLRVAPA